MCVRRTILEGKRAGFVSGVGAATADAIFACIAAFGLTFVSDWLIGYQQEFRIAGGAYLLWVGGSALFAQQEITPRSRRRAEFHDFLSAFALPLTNPITIVAFLPIFTAILPAEEATLGRAAILVLGVWAGSLLWWLALSLGVGSPFPSFGPRQLRGVNRGSGTILFLSGVALLAFPLIKHI